MDAGAALRCFALAGTMTSLLARHECRYEDSSIGTSTGARMKGERNITLLKLVERVDRRTLAIIACLFGVALMLAYRPWRQIEVGDPAFYDYIAQSILRGQVPYRDVVDIKGPGGAYLSAFAMLLGKAVGLRDVIAVRLMHVVLVGFLSAITYLVAEIYLRNRLAAVIAFLVPLMPEHFAMMVIAGTQPKLPMILCGMITLFLIAKDRPFWAGVFSMLSCVCWQPGLLFTGIAVLMFSRYLTSWRDLRALKVLIGAAIPLIIVLSYFYSRSALSDLWAWAITYNYSVFGPEAKRGIGEALDKLWKISVRVFRADAGGFADTRIGRFKSHFETPAGLATLVMIPSAFIGLVIFGFERARASLTRAEGIGSPDLFRDALLVPPLIYLAFCVINFQAGPDLIPFFPFIGIFAGSFFIKFGQLLASINWFKLRDRRVVKEWYIAAFGLSLILIIIFTRAITYRVDSWTLQSQGQEIKKLSDLLAPDDKIYVHGTVEILVLLNRPNLNPYADFDWGKDNFAASKRGVSFDQLIDEMEAAAPKLVAISRLRAVSHRADIEAWVQDHYDRLDLVRYDRVFIRRKD